ncbi:uncharacterized protein PODANS_4_8520 [Podospora anserina S mat+]|uniref:Podospora anserina S mat+ genomic DNA chromosome 4, supercontig 4 n=1 Tax=Podospora anserina (strain S / ATCC MYA-4624 / DSM 980 / FGSC 10383) TaxID=515849 RepID=B2AR62_PODAN|nr:uncharacterized protein PODANS_4_8520 [Podospora anserina S mat+]CAP66640.1 unnamed protein product [Podospora anserina S mat+]CDP28376.1 Putative replication licensing factor mcm10 [Podospora anserina S mat+]
MAAQWPPRSPREALLSTPGGREKLRRLADRSSPSPSPSKLRNSRSQPSLGMGEQPMYDGAMDLDDEEEDEEMLQLKLQAIQAKLKLKKLQAARAHKKASSLSEPGPQNGGAVGAGVTREIPFQSRLALARERIERPPTQAPVEVPASPVRKSATMSNLDASPKRVLLGIDKGRKATEMSLKRPASQRQLGTNNHQQTQSGSGMSNFPRRAKSPEAARPLSFNERLASARTEEAARQEQAKRVQKARSTAFSIGRQEMEEYKAKAEDLPEVPYKPDELSRDQLLSALGRTNSTATAPTGAPTGYLRRSRTASDLRNTITTKNPNADSSDLFLGPSSVSSSFSAPANNNNNNASDSSFEIFSSFHLSKRILPHPVLARAVSSKKIYQLKDLLKHVKAPDWSLPDVESDIVVFAILASKSDPRSHRPGPSGTQSDRGKYMVLTLVDLQFEVELFLFNSGFDRFYKLTPGTVVAILNPSVLPPPKGREDTGRFGLVINSDEDTILEVGKARDLGYCKSVKKDGQLCNGWVNGRRTEYCEFHTNEAVRKARGGRMELNNTVGSGMDGAKKANSREWYGKKEKDVNQGYDRFTGTKYFVSRGTADGDDGDEMGMADRVERQEALKRRLLKREKERDIARQLGSWGGGAGKDYMSRAAGKGGQGGGSFTSSTVGSSQTQPQTGSSVNGSGSFGSTVGTSFGSLDGGAVMGSQQRERRYDAAALGLTGRRGQDAPKVELGPVKRKRPVSSASSSTVSTMSASVQGVAEKAQPKVALGWGSGLTTKLGRMREGERLDGRKMEVERLIAASRAARDDKSPVRKKTRFVTEKGIREAGRDSLGEGWGVSVGSGTALPAASVLSRSRRRVMLDDDDDDDLIIVK